MRTDANNNPTAFTTDLAEQGLEYRTEWVTGTPFPDGKLHTAKLIGDPVALTIKLLDKVGYYTHQGVPRWSYIAIPMFTWIQLSYGMKRDIIGFHYRYEGGTEMRGLFPNYGRI